MIARIVAFAACFLAPGAACAETVYKYRRPDGRTLYSNRLEPGLELIETFEYRFSAPAPPSTAAPAAAGGPMGTQRGGRRNAEYFERTGALEEDLRSARARFDAAMRRYNELR